MSHNKPDQNAAQSFTDGHNQKAEEKPFKKEHRKFQVSNSYPLDFDQLARVLNFLYENRTEKKIKRTVIQEDTGFADRHVESLVSMGTAIGLITPNRQILSGCRA